MTHSFKRGGEVFVWKARWSETVALIAFLAITICLFLLGAFVMRAVGSADEISENWYAPFDNGDQPNNIWLHIPDRSEPKSLNLADRLAELIQLTDPVKEWRWDEPGFFRYRDTGYITPEYVLCRKRGFCFEKVTLVLWRLRSLGYKAEPWAVHYNYQDDEELHVIVVLRWKGAAYMIDVTRKMIAKGFVPLASDAAANEGGILNDLLVYPFIRTEHPVALGDLSCWKEFYRPGEILSVKPGPLLSFSHRRSPASNHEQSTP